MATRTEDSGPGDPLNECRASLQIELQAAERQVLATFREAFLKWLNERSSSGLSRTLGAPAKLALEEVEPSGVEPGPTLRLTVSWPRQRQESSAPLTVNGKTELPEALPRPSMRPVENFVFFPDLPLREPLYREIAQAVRAADSSPARQRPARARVFDRARSLVRALPAAFRAEQPLLIWQRLVLGGKVTVRVPVIAPHLRTEVFAALGAAATVIFATGVLYVGFAGQLQPRQRGRDVSTRVDASAAALQDASVDTVVEGPERPAATRLSVIKPAALRSDAPATPRVSAAGPAASPLGTTGTVVHPGPLPARTDTRAGKDRPSEPRRTGRAAPSIVRPGNVAAKESPQAGSSVKGALLVTSDPVGAEVSINGVPHGRTPVMIRNLAVGSRVVRLELDGYERWSWAVRVVANRQTPVAVKLQPEARGSITPN